MLPKKWGAIIMNAISTLEQAIDFCLETVSSHPESDRTKAVEAFLAGKRRPYPVISIGSQYPGDTSGYHDFELPSVEAGDTLEGSLAREMIDMLRPLKYLNPVNLAFGLGKGPGTLAPCFGIPLNLDAQNSPAFTKTIDEILSESIPEPGKTGLMPEMHGKIMLIKDHVPPSVKIGMPDTQGLFNIAHTVTGDDALLMPYTDPEKFHRFMDALADFWIATVKMLYDWIGPEYTHPSHKATTICECSVNLISREMYEEFVLPYDLRVSEAFESIHIHPCSGPHVFHATLDNIPNITFTEAGYIERTAAGSIGVDEALEAIGDRPISLSIGQELPVGSEFEFITRDLNLYESNYRLMFSYTGMGWQEKDTSYMLDLHRRADEYWAAKYGP